MIALLAIVLAASPDLTQYETQLVAEVNNARSEHGLAPLAVDDTLMEQCRRHSLVQCRSGMHHSSTGFRRENVAYGQSTPRQAFLAWWNSSGHYACIMDRGATRVGVAGYTHRGRTYWTMQTK